jgi:hypothetical protein
MTADKKTGARRAPVSAAMVRRSAVSRTARSGAASAALVVHSFISLCEILFILFVGASRVVARASTSAAPAGAAAAARAAAAATTPAPAATRASATRASATRASTTRASSAAPASPAAAPAPRATSARARTSRPTSASPAAAHSFLVRRRRLDIAVAAVLLVRALFSILVRHVSILHA